MITLTEYINYRLGTTPRAQAKDFLSRPFGAKSFAEFWQYWNPVWGYYLFYKCYRPLKRYFPRSISMFLTFFVCGLLHDLPFALIAHLRNGTIPFFTITTFFALIGLLVIFTEKIRLQFANIPTGLRWVIHASVIFICYRMAVYLTT